MITPAGGPACRNLPPSSLVHSNNLLPIPLDRTELTTQHTATTRYYLISRSRFEGLKKMPYFPRMHFEELWGEKMVNMALHRTELPPKHRNDGKDLVWAIHLGQTGPAATAHMIYCMERGKYPLEQLRVYEAVTQWSSLECTNKKRRIKPQPVLTA